MMSEWTVRQAVVSDAPVLHPLINKAYRTNDSWTSEASLIAGERIQLKDLEQTIRSKTILVLVTNDNRIVGSIEIEHYDADLRRPVHHETQSVLLGLFAIDTTQQSKGLGTQLLNAAIGWARGHGKQDVYIWVIHVRKDIMEWYIRKGFIQTGNKVAFVFPELQKIDDAHFDEMKLSISNG